MKTLRRLGLALFFLLAFALTVVPVSADRYTLIEVIDACEGAYDSGQQIDQCITNVCGFYGCAE